MIISKSNIFLKKFWNFLLHFGSWTTYTTSSHLDILMTNQQILVNAKNIVFASEWIWMNVLSIIL